MKKAKIFENFGLKILAVVIAVLVWLVVVNLSDPVINTPFSDIPLVVTNTDVVTSEGKVYELIGEDTVTISVSAKRSILDYLSEDNFKAVVDLKQYDEETGTVPVRVESNKYSDKIESMKSKTEVVSVNIENMLRKQFLITPVVSGEPEEGYVIGDMSTAENIVRISGAESVVSSIKKVTAEVSVSGLSSSINTSVDLRLYDEEGNQIEDKNLTKNISTVGVSAQILATKEVPLRFSTGGTPKEGYCVSGEVQSDRESVLVAGKNTLLNSISVLEVPSAAVSVEGADRDLEIEVDLSRYLPEGLRLVDEDETRLVNVKVPVDAIVIRKIQVAKNNIQITGLPDNMEIEFTGTDETVEITLSGTAADISKVNEGNIAALIDLKKYAKDQEISTLKEGTYYVPVTVQLPAKVTLTKEIQVNIRIAEKE